MAYGREMLRKAGQGVGNFLLDQDAKYAKAVSPGRDDAFGEMTRGTSLRDAFNSTQIEKPENMLERVLDTGLVAAVPAANIASRYALPAGGVTLAGVGLANLGNSMRQAFAPTPEEAMDYAAQFEEAGMPEYAAQMRAAAGVQTSGTIMPG
jgi:hypothetical protein